MPQRRPVAPREPGARLIIAENGLFRGTVGGGALEWRAIAEAQAALARGGSAFFMASSVLGPDLGWIALGVGAILTQLVATTVVGASTALLYLDLRIRLEGLDLAWGAETHLPQ